MHHFVQRSEFDRGHFRFESRMGLWQRFIQIRLATATKLLDRLLVNGREYSPDFVERRVLIRFGCRLRTEFEGFDERVGDKRFVCGRSATHASQTKTVLGY